MQIDNPNFRLFILNVTVVVDSYFLSKCSVRALCRMYGEEDGELF